MTLDEESRLILTFQLDLRRKMFEVFCTVILVASILALVWLITN